MENRKPRLVSIARGDKAEIFRSINKEAAAEGYEVLRAVNKTTPEDGEFFELYQGKADDLWNRFTTKISGGDGFKNKKGTKRLLKVLESYKPDLIIVHFAHSHFVNFPMVVKFAKSHDLPLVFVANDCWVFTGKCPYFLGVNCYKWKTECHHCPDKRNFPPALIFDGTKRLFEEKKKLLSSYEGLTVVAPTKWTLDLLKESFLKDRDARLIYNGTNLSLFYPIDPSPLRKKLGIPDRCRVLLSVARPWSVRKGLAYVNLIASKLDPDLYRFVVVGVGKNDVTHPAVIRIEDRLSYEDLRQVYSLADVFVNPTMDEVFGLVNTEALACGTPIVAFDSGGVREAFDSSCGYLVKRGDVDDMTAKIILACEKPFPQEACTKFASSFGIEKMAKEYVSLFDELIKRGRD